MDLDLLKEILVFVADQGKCSTDAVKVRFNLGHAKASDYVAELERLGHVGPVIHGKPRATSTTPEVARAIADGHLPLDTFKVGGLDERAVSTKGTATFTYGRNRVTVEADDLEGVMEALKPKNDLPLVPGKLLHTILSRFTCKPPKDCLSSKWSESIGIGLNSVVACDGQVAVRIGDADSAYLATLREEAFIEAERAKQWNVSANIAGIDRMCTSEGEIMPYGGKVGEIIEGLASFTSVAVLDPELVKSAATVAVAAGATAFEILLDRKNDTVLGFKFSYQPVLQTSLFDDSDKVGTPVKVAGVLVQKTRWKSSQKEDDTDGE